MLEYIPRFLQLCPRNLDGDGNAKETSPLLCAPRCIFVATLDELAHHGNHQVEQTNGFDESETQNGVGEELTTEGRVAGDTKQKSTEHETDTNTG